jgi:hypothetical protein
MNPIMNKQNIGKQPDIIGGKGTEKEPEPFSEVAGRGKRKVMYTCWNCGAVNYVDPDWQYFLCWRCTLNYI